MSEPKQPDKGSLSEKDRLPHGYERMQPPQAKEGFPMKGNEDWAPNKEAEKSKGGPSKPAENPSGSGRPL